MHAFCWDSETEQLVDTSRLHLIQTCSTLPLQGANCQENWGLFQSRSFLEFQSPKKVVGKWFFCNRCCWQVLTIHIACTNLGRCLKYLQTVQWLIMAHPVRNDGSLRAVDIWYMIKLKDIGYMIYDICMQYTYTKQRKIVDTRCGALFLVIYSIFRV